MSERAVQLLACPYCPHASTTRRRFKNHLFFMHQVQSAGVAAFRAPTFRAEAIDAR